MELEQLTEIAQTFDLKVSKNADKQSVIYQILDAQADRHGAEVQARAEAREERRKGKRTRIQTAPQKVNTDNLKSNRVLATVGSKEETMGQIKEEQARQPQPKPVVSGVQPSLFEASTSIVEEKVTEQPQAVETKETEQPAKKKKNRKAKKTETATAEIAVEESVETTEATPALATEPANQDDKQPKSKKRGRPKKEAVAAVETTKEEEVTATAEPTEENDVVAEATTKQEVRETEEVSVANKEQNNPNTPSRKNETKE